MSSFAFQLSTSKLLQGKLKTLIINSLSRTSNGYQGRVHVSNLVSAHIYDSDVETEKMGKRSRMSDPDKRGDSGGSLQRHWNKQFNKRKNWNKDDISKYREYLMRNEDKFNRDIHNITEKKKKSIKNIDANEKPVPSFRPKLVADFRHQSSSFTRVEESPSSRGHPGQREPSVISISSGSEESGDVEVVSATSHSGVTPRGSGNQSNRGQFRSSDRPSSSRAGSGAGAGAGLGFSVLSYNILADVLQRRHPELYTSCRAEHLDWAARWAAIKAQIAGLGWPDVVCLQVVPQKVASELHPKVRNHGEGPD